MAWPERDLGVLWLTNPKNNISLTMEAQQEGVEDKESEIRLWQNQLWYKISVVITHFVSQDTSLLCKPTYNYKYDLE